MHEIEDACCDEVMNRLALVVEHAAAVLDFVLHELRGGHRFVEQTGNNVVRQSCEQRIADCVELRKI